MPIEKVPFRFSWLEHNYNWSGHLRHAFVNPVQSGQEMIWFHNRRNSLQHCPFIQSEDIHYLAENGFYYNHADGNLICYKCGKQITPYQWKIRGRATFPQHAGDCPILGYHYSSNNNRQDSFHHHRRPTSLTEEAQHLAQAGFYYSEDSDELICHEHGCRIDRNTVTDEDAKQLHKKNFPFCPFVRRGFRERTHRNDDDDEQYSWSFTPALLLADILGLLPRIIRDDDRKKKKRLHTFQEHHWPLNAPVTSEDLARSGFFFLGTSDSVRCEFCHITIQHWQHGDNAMERHRRESPNCPFVEAMDNLHNHNQAQGCGHPRCTFGHSRKYCIINENKAPL